MQYFACPTHLKIIPLTHRQLHIRAGVNRVPEYQEWFDSIAILLRSLAVALRNYISIPPGKFRLQVTALDQIAPYAKAKVWLKPSAEQQFLYGHNVLKGGISRLSENVEKYQGIIVYNMNDVPLGFGVAAKSTQESRNADPMTIVVFHQADVGEYLRCEDTLL